MHASAGPGVRRGSVRTELAFAALLLGMLLAQLDTNVVVAALPVIGRDLGSASSVAGVTAVYLLTVTVGTPVIASLGDRRGRRAAFGASTGLFALGSAACALAPSLPVLVVARAVQGFGGGGLVVTAVSALGLLFAREELLRRQIWLTGVLAVSSLAGPPLGGLLAAGPGWRWIFAVNLPLCLLAPALGLRGLPGRPAEPPTGRFDLRGALLVAVGGAAVVTLGSNRAAAGSPLPAAGLVTAALLAAAAFVHVERRAAAPLLPLEVFGQPVLARSVAVTGLASTALFGTFTVIPLAVATGTGRGSATTGGLLLALTGGQLAVTTTFSLLARRHPHVARWGRAGLGLGVVGLALLAVLPQLAALATGVTVAVALVGMALVGAALGLSLQSSTLLAQASAPVRSFGAAMGALTSARQLGGSLGAAAFGWLLLTVADAAWALTLALGLGAVLVLAAGGIAAGLRDDAPDAGGGTAR